MTNLSMHVIFGISKFNKTPYHTAVTASFHHWWIWIAHREAKLWVQVEQWWLNRNKYLRTQSKVKEIVDYRQIHSIVSSSTFRLWGNYNGQPRSRHNLGQRLFKALDTLASHLFDITIVKDQRRSHRIGRWNSGNA
jgi:hypothetical protein